MYVQRVDQSSEFHLQVAQRCQQSMLRQPKPAKAGTPICGGQRPIAQRIHQSSEFHLYVAQRCQQSMLRQPKPAKAGTPICVSQRPNEHNSHPYEKGGSLFLSYFLLSWIDHSQTTEQEDQEGTGGTRNTESTW